MVRMREHIDRLYFANGIALFDQNRQIACLRFGVAGNVNDAARRKLCGGTQKFGGAAGTRRVHEQYVRLLSVLCHRSHKITRVRAVKSRVADAVPFAVEDRVAHSVAVQLHTDHAACLARGSKTDRADAAIGVDNGFRAVQTGKVDRCLIQHFRLYGVDLVERFARLVGYGLWLRTIVVMHGCDESSACVKCLTEGREGFAETSTTITSPLENPRLTSTCRR